MTVFLDVTAPHVALLLLVLVSETNGDNYFCDLSCPWPTDQRNTLCELEPCAPGSECGINFDMLPMSNEDRLRILDLHNTIRNDIALGKVTEGENGAASDMQAMSYSKELEFGAQCWANQCTFTHDKCRRTKIFSIVGQNIFKASGTDGNVTHTINSWYSERGQTTKTILQWFTIDIKKVIVIGHFTQLAWAYTNRVGCGRVLFTKAPNDHFVYTVCNYGPAGNIKDNPVYTFGSACTACPHNLKCGTTYTGLCGAVQPLGNDKWKPPFKMAGSTRIPQKILIVFAVISLFIMYNHSS